MSNSSMINMTVTRRFGATGGAIALIDEKPEEAAFISAASSNYLDLREGDRLFGLIRENTVNPDSTKWFAHRVFPRAVDRSEPTPAIRMGAPTRQPLGERILDLLANGDPWTAEEIFDELGAPLDLHSTQYALDKLVEEQRIAYAVLFGTLGGEMRRWFFLDPSLVDMFAVEDE